MYDLITVGSATLDIVVKSKHFMIQELAEGVALCERYGEKVDVEQLKFVSGGGATNVAVGASRLGLKVATVCEIGKDLAATVILDDLKKENVDDRFVIRERLEETAVSILLASGEGGRSALTHRGAAYELESRDIPWHSLSSTRWIHLGTLGGRKGLLFDLFEFVEHHQLPTSWTPSLKDLQLFIEKKLSVSTISCSVLVLNASEWETARSIQDEILDEVETVIVTDGKNGGKVYQDGKELLTYDSIAIKTVEETGAGDAFCTGFISAQIMHKSVNESVDWGKKNAASVVQFLGAKEGLLTREKIVA